MATVMMMTMVTVMTMPVAILSEGAAAAGHDEHQGEKGTNLLHV